MDEQEARLRKLLETAKKNYKQGNEYSFDPVFKFFYKKYKKRCHKNSTFKAAFLDAMFKVWEKFILKKDSLPNKLVNYVSSMIENTWINHQKKGGKNKPIQMADEIVDYLNIKENLNKEHNPLIKNENNNKEAEYQKKRIWALAISFTKLSECCQKILIALYYENKKLKDLSGICNLKNYTTLKSKASQCRKKWRDLSNDLLDE